MTDIRIDRPEETKTQTKKYYKSKYCFSLHLPKELEEKVKEAAESEARNVTSYITSLILKDLKEKELVWKSLSTKKEDLISSNFLYLFSLELYYFLTYLFFISLYILYTIINKIKGIIISITATK